MSSKFWNAFHRFYNIGLVLAFFFIVVPLFYPVFFAEEEVSKAIQNKYTPTPIQPEEVGEQLTEEKEYTLDASDQQKFVYFDFSRSSVVEIEDASSKEWDLAFRRVKILTNSGFGNSAGKGGAALVGKEDFKKITSLPETLEFTTDYIPPKKAQPENKTLAHWYEYGFMKHRLNPSPLTYAIRTADGKFAKIQIISYYCGPKAGCYTLRYIYQGNGSKNFVE